MWVDPGKQTGNAVLGMNDHYGFLEFGAREDPFFIACELIEAVASSNRMGLAIGWERFDINAGTHKMTREGINDALHVIGVCRYIAAKYGCRVLEPAQQHTPDPAERTQLKKLGWWVPGKDDAQSAACHMLRWLIRENELTPLQRAVVYGDDRPQQ
jgi:hypothetical protein